MLSYVTYHGVRPDTTDELIIVRILAWSVALLIAIDSAENRHG